MPLGVLGAAAVTLCTALVLSSVGATAPSEHTAPPVIPALAVKIHPHDPAAFCQGLVFHNGHLLEGTGQYGDSRLRILDLRTGLPSWERKLDDSQFGEGITVLGDRLYQLTWKNGFLIEYDATTLVPQRTVAYRQFDRSLRE
ncbi:MAG: glutaminyl-peptide cyclotransferase, partial [Planctomycetaceae bacterium]|nr:glutaminyl-peptide cyclotransferase [Planctomycetaceae bacterium]